MGKKNFKKRSNGSNKNYKKKTGFKKQASNKYLKVKRNIEANKESEENLKRQQIGMYILKNWSFFFIIFTVRILFF